MRPGAGASPSHPQDPSPDSRFCARRRLRCCRWWPGWTHTPPGTRACGHSRSCCSRRWCRHYWCSHRRTSGPPHGRQSPTPRQKWSPGLAGPGWEGGDRCQPSLDAPAGFSQCRGMAAVRGTTAPAMAPAHLPQEEAQKGALGPDGGPKCVVSGLLDVNRVLGETLDPAE